MLRSVNLSDHMLTHPVKINGDAPLTEAMDLIIQNRVSGICVVDGSGNLIGILSELDCLRAVLGAVYNKSKIGLVRDYMASENLVVAHPHEDIIDVAQDMLMNNRRRRPVVEEGRLVGQITCRQLLKAVREFQTGE